MEQQGNNLNIALLSPNENAYSETFIQAHKNFIRENIFYYYGGYVPQFLENFGRLDKELKSNRAIRKILTCLRYNREKSNVDFLRESFLTNKINVVLAEYGPTAAESLPAIKAASIPLVVHFHGFDAHNNDIVAEYKDRYGEMFEYAHRVIVVSQYMKMRLVALGCPEDKIVYTVCAPNEEYFNITPSFKVQQFIAIGRFVDKKAPYYTILAFKDALKDYPDAKLKIAGDGLLFPMCKNLVKYFGLQDNVEFLGVVGRDAIKKEMSQSLVFVQHSIIAENGDSEGTPVAVMEASAASLPVIATRHAGIKDVVIEGKTGILVDEHDISGMTTAMISLLSDPLLAKKLGGAARERIQKQFSMERHISIIEGTLKDAINK